METQGIVLQTNSTGPNVAAVLTVLSAYSVSVGALYLWGYWGWFDINVMEHLGLSDIVKAAAWPVLSWFVFLVAGMFLGESLDRDRLPPGGGRDTPLGRTLWRFRSLFKWGYCLIIAALLAFGGPRSWQPVSLLIAITLAGPLTQAPLLETLIPGGGLRRIVAFGAVVMPLWAYGQGQMNAEAIREGHGYQYVLPDSDGVNGLEDSTKSLRYLGLAGVNFFFWDPAARSVRMIPGSSIKALNLKKSSPYQPTFGLMNWMMKK